MAFDNLNSSADVSLDARLDARLDGIYLRPIAHIRTDFAQKFGIPRQSGLAEHAQGVIVFEPEFARNAAVAGLDEFTHLWLIWQFENGREGGSAADIQADATDAAGAAAGAAVGVPGATGAAGVPSVPASALTTPPRTPDQVVCEALSRNWSSTVRPPRLGGTEKKGVFATRSPFRPNPLGLSCVAIERVELTAAGPRIHVRGADLRDNTPIFDIKPYLPRADCKPNASGGFTDRIAETLLDVQVDPGALDAFPTQKQAALLEVIANDPRPVGVEDDPSHIYQLAYAGFDVRFSVDAAHNAARILSADAIC